MKILVDVNASGAIANWLESMGHDIVRASTKDPRMSDDDILTWAVQENRVIITTDKDFEEMVWRAQRPHRGILRLENLPRQERKLLLEEAIEHYQQELENGAIVIAQQKKFRVRKSR
ncbi:MAG: DUF5615 family PIN-like protein [Anaerolineae bacterium]|nr:DUF5615 family PIN-like protein [Anaerolineae bacterium]